MKSACVGVLWIIDLENARWNIGTTGNIFIISQAQNTTALQQNLFLN